MTDTPGREPDGRSPRRRPSSACPSPAASRAEVAPVERFTSPPSIAHRVELTPERAAQVVRQSSNARWVGFLAVVVVILFVIDLLVLRARLPGRLTVARLEPEIDAQQVTAVERGYNVYQANCARCHGENGEGGIGPVLNSQDKLFAHLNEDYLPNVLKVGGRYVCAATRTR